MKSVAFVKPPRLNLDSCDKETGSGQQYLPRTPYPHDLGLSPIPSPQVTASPTSTSPLTLAQRQQQLFDLYPPPEVQEEISRILRENLVPPNPRPVGGDHKKGRSPTHVAGAEVSEDNKDGDENKNKNEIDIEIGYDVVVFAIDDQMQLRKVHPLLCSGDDPVFTRPDQALARRLRVHFHIPSSHPTFRTSQLDQAEQDRRCRDTIERLRCGALAEHGLLDTGIEVRYTMPTEKKCEPMTKGWYSDGGSDAPRIWIPPDRVWHPATGRMLGEDDIKDYIRDLRSTSHQHEDDGETGEIPDALAKSEFDSEGEEKEQEGVKRNGMETRRLGFGRWRRSLRLCSKTSS